MKKRKHIMVAVCDYCPHAVTHVSLDGKIKTCIDHHEHIDSGNYEVRTA